FRCAETGMTREVVAARSCFSCFSWFQTLLAFDQDAARSGRRWRSAGKSHRYRARTSPDPSMLRVTELKLPLGHPPDALRAAVRGRLGLADADLLEMVVARRANDARRKSAILMVYSVDVALADEAAV